MKKSRLSDAVNVADKELDYPVQYSYQESLH